MNTIAFVLKSGGDYDVDYVHRLLRMVDLHVSRPHQCVLLTDLTAFALDGIGCHVVDLRHDLPAWWSKLEVFRIMGPVLYLDLDTVLVGSIEPLLAAVHTLATNEIIMLRGFRDLNFASGIMGWNGDFTWLLSGLLDKMRSQRSTFSVLPRGITLELGDKRYRGDQNYITEALEDAGARIIAVQTVQPGIISYKHHVLRAGLPLPDDTSIVCFHGTPRPHEVLTQHDWMVPHA